MISMYQLMITIGILGAYLSDTAFSYSGAWRWMLGVIIIPAVLLLIGVFFLPDSPRWFAAKRRFHDAERVLLRLRDTSAEAKNELEEIRESLKVKQSGWALFKEKQQLPPRGVPWRAVTGNATVHRDERHHVLRAKNL
ncbi:sugar transporter [Enterobacter cloacae]|uniref:Sugar transporter n=1 Tax=Enterobacter cloacae TaxID=550 RepID=A0A377LTF5_ENTCL|nr:sugar transporter [Enterobacter cloacae]